LRDAIATSKALLEKTAHGRGNSWVLDSVSLNIGTIHGGVKVNVVPARCVAEFDFRLPVGMTPDGVISEFKELLREQGLGEDDVTIETINACPPSHTDPEAEIVQTLARNAESVTGRLPHLHMTSWGSDCRFWRFKGVPAAILGPVPYNMGACDEHIEITDYVTTLKVHLGTIIDYLGVAE
jgi:acetylornithine deacetylase/succinyl-diaminopimelate desuccinylase-like protein